MLGVGHNVEIRVVWVSWLCGGEEKLFAEHLAMLFDRHLLTFRV